ncbi:MAG: ATPase [Chloroflexi bacterium]|nr:MAG: ATPase [Chloroflexota bacterium]HDN80467.1 ATPase [Chloroflexota bacterium]
MDIMFLIDRLEEFVQKGVRIPFTSLIILNEDDLLGIIDQLRLSIPEEVDEARRITQERENLIAQAREEAERIVGQAQERAASLASEHEIVKRAEARARTIEERARKKAEELKKGADEYVLEVLGSLEGQLEEFLRVVRNGIEKVRREKGDIASFVEAEEE